MKIQKIIQLTIATALALGHNVWVEASSIKLNTPVIHAINSAGSMLPESASYIFSDPARKVTNSMDDDILPVGNLPDSPATPGIAFGNHPRADTFLPGERRIPSTGSSTSTGHSTTSSVSPAPEPNVAALLLASIGLIGFMSYRRQRYFS